MHALFLFLNTFYWTNKRESEPSCWSRFGLQEQTNHSAAAPRLWSYRKSRTYLQQGAASVCSELRVKPRCFSWIWNLNLRDSAELSSSSEGRKRLWITKTFIYPLFKQVQSLFEIKKDEAKRAATVATNTSLTRDHQSTTEHMCKWNAAT